jgi:4-amino-4-deoxy-L-arabinose transferase-like glycosyltransferase
MLRAIGLNWALPNTYEEATPLRVAVGMSGWQNGGHGSLNPGFFNYPSLTFYIHLAVQHALFWILRLSDAIHSASDWYVLYLTDPTYQYVAARLVGVVFAAATVSLQYFLTRAIDGRRSAIMAAALLATNPYHIARSQMIEVDVPLTCFTLLAILAMVHITRQGGARSYILAGVATGLAASTKYTGVLLLAPLLIAHVVRMRRVEPKTRLHTWRWLLLAVASCALAFACTSPYVLLDWSKARADFLFEREHMALGHFGSESSSPWSFYGHALVGEANVAVGLLALLGTILLIRKRERPFWVLASLIGLYVVAVMTWRLKADRYLLPILPCVLMLAAVAASFLANWYAQRTRVLRSADVLAGAICCGLVVFNLSGLATQREANQYDARSDAQNWIEANLPAGSLIVMESQGPDLVDPVLLTQLDPALRQSVLERWKRRPIFGTIALPMYQTRPERSAPFYDTDLYSDADYFVITRAVKGRYEKDQRRYSAQVAFYHRLNQECTQLKEFRDRDGIALTIYQVPGHQAPFAARASVAGPPTISRSITEGTNREAGFYFSLGSNYEYFHHWAEAASCYRLALEYRTRDRNLFAQCLISYTRCLVAAGRRDEALRDLAQLRASTDDAQLRNLITQLVGRVNSAGR